MALDLHCGQIQGFFRIPVDNLYCRPVLIDGFKPVLKSLKNVCVVSPDAGGTERADGFRRGLKKYGIKASMAMMNKSRREANQVSSMELVGEVKDCDAIIVDDIIDTAGTLVKCAQILKENGARRVFATATHALFNGKALELITNSPLEKVVVSDSVPLSPEAKKNPKIVRVSCANLLAACIQKVHDEKSVSDLFPEL
jgi:ribose-phosphate pyrophosphokinase